MAFIDRLMSKINTFVPRVLRSILIIDNAPIYLNPKL